VGARGFEPLTSSASRMESTLQNRWYTARAGKTAGQTLLGSSLSSTEQCPAPRVCQLFVNASQREFSSDSPISGQFDIENSWARGLEPPFHGYLVRASALPFFATRSRPWMTPGVRHWCVPLAQRLRQGIPNATVSLQRYNCDRPHKAHAAKAPITVVNTSRGITAGRALTLLERSDGLFGAPGD
jgi:hypothetical protein